MEVYLNAKKYVIVGSVLHVPVWEFTEPIRYTSTQKRTDRTLLSSWEIQWKKGIGWRRFGQQPTEGLWYSTCDTRWDGQITEQPLQNAVTYHANQVDYNRGPVNFNGSTTDLSHYTTTRWDVNTFSAGVWTSVANQLEQGGVGTLSVLDCEVHGGLLMCLARYNNNATHILRTWDGTTFASAAATGISATTDVAAVSVSLNGNYYVISKSNTSGTCTVNKSTDNGATFTSAFTFTVNTPPLGKATYLDNNGKSAIWIHTADDLFLLDITNSIAIPLHIGPFNNPTASHDRNINGCLTVHQGSLYAATKQTVYRFTWNGNALVQEDVGPFANGRQFPSNQWSGTTLVGLNTLGKWLVVGTINGTNDGGILAYDPKKEAWHSLATVNNGANQCFPLGFVNNVFFMTTAANTMKYLNNANQDPISTSGYTYQSGGKVWTPHFYGELQEINARWLQLNGNNEGLSANTYITVKYGADYADPNTTSLVTFNNTTTSSSFGSGIGTKAVVLSLEFAFTQADNTHSPILHEPSVYFEKVYAHRSAFAFDIDVEASAKAQSVSPDQIVKQIETAYDSVTLLTFKFGRHGNDGGTGMQVYNVAFSPERQFQYSTGAFLQPLPPDQVLGRVEPQTGLSKFGTIRIYLAERI